MSENLAIIVQKSVQEGISNTFVSYEKYSNNIKNDYNNNNNQNKFVKKIYS